MGQRNAAACFLVVGLLSGCASNFTNTVKSRAPEQGLTEISASYRWGFTTISTQAFIPGKDTHRGTLLKRSCRRSGITVELEISAPVAASTQSQLCEMTLSAAEFTRQRMPAVRLDYKIVAVPAGTRLDKRWSSLSPPEKKVLTLAIPMFQDQAKTFSVLVDTVAHETFHVAGFLNRIPDAADETKAYYFGICANFDINKSLTVWDLPGAPLGNREAGEVAGKSSRAGYAVRLQVAKFMLDGRIDLGAPGAQMLNEKCRSALTRR